MKFSKEFTILFATCSLLTLTSCEGNTIKDTLGLNRRAPDEFRVVSRPPLSVPPQFNLRPPLANAESPIIIPADKQAKSIITGNSVELNYSNVDTAVIPVESASLDTMATIKNNSNKSQFMKNIGADKADPNVRNELIQQKIVAQEKKEEASWWDNITSKTTEKKETLVNAKEESKRILTNKTENKPITEGQTPEIKDKDHGIIGNIFGW